MAPHCSQNARVRIASRESTPAAACAGARASDACARRRPDRVRVPRAGSRGRNAATPADHERARGEDIERAPPAERLDELHRDERNDERPDADPGHREPGREPAPR